MVRLVSKLHLPGYFGVEHWQPHHPVIVPQLATGPPSWGNSSLTLMQYTIIAHTIQGHMLYTPRAFPWKLP